MSNSDLPTARGRGSPINLPNRFHPIEIEDDLDYLEHDEEAREALRSVRTEYFSDNSKTIISENDSPDIPFRYSLNVYRGCAHGCSYCFARPTHEYLDLSAGLDFETKILVKERAPELLRDWLARDRYQCEPITISGVTDCYQPVEKKLGLTRRCLEVALEARQPIALVTKNALVTRDIDLLKELAALRAVSVAVSITTLDQSLVKVMEPRTSSPAAKLRTVEELAKAGVRTHVLIAPVIPGLTDHEIPAILEQAKNAGAASAAYILLRLPLTVKPVFLDWLNRMQPERKAKIESRIRSTRGGKLYESEFGVRMQGRGEIAEQIHRTFEVFARRYGLDKKHERLDTTQFRRPLQASGQRRLFD